MVTRNHMPLRRLTIEVPGDLLVREGVVPAAFFAHNESVEILHVYSFQPRERVLLVRVVRSGPRRTLEQIMRSRARLRRRYRLRDFEILRVEDGGRAYVALLRQRNPGALEALLEDLGARGTPTTPTVIRKDSPTPSFPAADGAPLQGFTLLDGPGGGVRRRAPPRARHPGTPTAG